MVKSCAAFNCTSRWMTGSNISFHKFPLNNTELLKKWTTATERKGFVPKKYTTLCSLHFTPNDFHEMLPNSTRKTLKNDAVPTIFDFLSHIPDSLPKERRTIIRNKSPETQGIPRKSTRTEAQNVEPLLENNSSVQEPVSTIPFEHDGPLFVSTDLDHYEKVKPEVGEEYLAKDPLSFSPKTENDVINNVFVNEDQDSDVKHCVAEPLGDYGDDVKPEPIEQVTVKVEEAGYNVEGVSSNTSSSDQLQALGECVNRNCESDIVGLALKSGNPNGTNNCYREKYIAVTENQQHNIVCTEQSLACGHCPDNEHNRLAAHTRAHSKILFCSSSEQHSQLVTHVTTHSNNDKPFACNQCPYRARKRSNVIAHLRTHKNEKPFACSQCTFRSNWCSDLVKHTRTHTNEKPFTCSQCTFRSNRRGDLVKHVRTHTNEKPFVCSQCSYRSNQSGDLVNHMRTHTNDKPFACSQCSFRAATHSNIVRHIRTHTNEKPFACSQCSYKSNRRDDLVKHMRTHTNEKPFACSQCSYRAAAHSTLIAHLRTHTNERPFACSQCSHRSNRRDDLVNHMRTHTNDKPFACSQCSFRAATHGNVVRHMRTHTNEKPFACSQCSYRSSRSLYLVKHMRTHTNE